MKENENLSNFLEKDDYIIIFFDMLRDFAFSKNPKLSPRINMSYLIKNYLKDFERHYGLKDERYYSYSDKPFRLGKELYEKGLYDLHIHTPEKKFMDKFGKLVKYLIGSKLDIPPGLNFTVSEETPNVVIFKSTVPYSTVMEADNNNRERYLKFLPGRSYMSYHIRDFFNRLESYLNLERGAPTTGGIQLEYSNEITGRQEWTQNFLKGLRAHVKSNPEIKERIKSIKLTENGNLNSIDLILTDPSQYESWGMRNVKRQEIESLFKFVKDYIKSKNINEHNFTVDSPTWRKHF